MRSIIIGLIVSGLLIVPAFADVKVGQKVYLKKFKTRTGLNGTMFATSHTVEEWNSLFKDDAKGFIDEYSKRYPKLTKFLSKPKNLEKILHVGDFAKEYASDSGNVPSCG